MKRRAENLGGSLGRLPRRQERSDSLDRSCGASINMRQEWWRDVCQACKVDLETGTISPIPTNGIACPNEYGLSHHLDESTQDFCVIVQKTPVVPLLCVRVPVPGSE